MLNVVRLLEVLQLNLHTGNTLILPTGFSFLLDPEEQIGLVGDYQFDTRNVRYETLQICTGT